MTIRAIQVLLGQCGLAGDKVVTRLNIKSRYRKVTIGASDACNPTVPMPHGCPPQAPDGLLDDLYPVDFAHRRRPSLRRVETAGRGRLGQGLDRAVARARGD